MCSSSHSKSCWWQRDLGMELPKSRHQQRTFLLPIYIYKFVCFFVWFVSPLIPVFLSNQLTLFGLVLPWLIPLDYKFPRDLSPLTYKILLSSTSLSKSRPQASLPPLSWNLCFNLLTSADLSESELRSIHLFICSFISLDLLYLWRIFYKWL